MLNVLLIALIVLIVYVQYRNAKVKATTSKPERSIGQQKTLEQIEAEIKQYTLPLIKIQPNKEKPEHPWSSKFGGNPMWPKSLPYPLGKDKEPLKLLAQINFDEVPDMNGYPTTGVLQFFIACDDLMGLKFADNGEIPEQLATTQDTFRVVYHETLISEVDQLLSEFPDMDDEYSPVNGEYSLAFALSEEYVSPTDYRFDKLGIDLFSLDDEIGELLYDKYLSEGSKIGGYANFTQEDPRGYGASSDDEWLLLFQMDTEYADGVDIMWGDSGVGNFFIRPDDLAQLNFKRVWYNWDCC